MSDETKAYATELCWLLGQFVTCLLDLSEEQLEWKPSTGQANSPCAIVSHVVASTRVYALGFGCNRPVKRDRAAEFAPSQVPRDELISMLQGLAEEIEATLTELPQSNLGRRTLPAQELWGTGQPHEISGREALLESIRHAAVHLGELRLTRDLACKHA